jgi:hypothetical protein
LLSSLARYALAWVILAVAKKVHPVVTSAQFRVILGFGALPSFIVLLSELYSVESTTFQVKIINKIIIERRKEEWVKRE